MPKTVIQIKTWRCPACDYAQDFSPFDASLMALHFPRVAVGDCPACSEGKNPTHVAGKTPMVQETARAKCIVMTIMGVEDIDAEIAKKDADRASQGLSLQTLAEKNTYQTKREADIASAIAEARKREYTP